MIGPIRAYNTGVFLTGLMVVGLVGMTRVAKPAAGGAAAQLPNCTTSDCHAKITRHKRVHQPVAANRCDFCHEPIEGSTPFQAGAKHEFKRATQNPELCYACHDRLTEEVYVHEPVKMGMCVLCHDPHGSERKFLLRVGTDRELCMQCHLETFNQGDHIHGPVSIGACGACHDPHQSPNRFRLRSQGTRQCSTCHLADMRSIMEATHVHPPVKDNCNNCHEPHASPNPFRLVSRPTKLCLDCHENIDKQVVHGASVHKPVAEGACVGCHEHHGSDFRRLLRGEFTSKLYERFDLGHYQLCYRCHQPAQVTQPKTNTATNFRNGDANLHFVHVKLVEKGRTCNVCHQIHASSNLRLIKQSVPFGVWQLPLNFKLTETGGSCFPGCHVRRGYDRIHPVHNK